jgi:hypothetical protein
MEELPDEARNAGFAAAIEELEKLSHSDDVIDHRAVDTRDSFADDKSPAASGATRARLLGRWLSR